MGNTSPWELLTQDVLSMKHCVLSPLIVPNFVSQEPKIWMNMLCTTPSSSTMYSHPCKPQNLCHEEACYKKLWQHSQAENVLPHHHVSCTCHRHEFLLVVMNSDHLKFRNERSNRERISVYTWQRTLLHEKLKQRGQNKEWVQTHMCSLRNNTNSKGYSGCPKLCRIDQVWLEEQRIRKPVRKMQ